MGFFWKGEVGMAWALGIEGISLGRWVFSSAMVRPIFGGLSIQGMLLGGWVVGIWFWWAGSVQGQQMSIGSPFHTVREGFFEQVGVQWGVQGRNWAVQFGGADLAQPTLGGLPPGAGIQGGFQFGGPGWNGQVQFSAGQGAIRTVISGTPSVTVMNGTTGYVADSSLSPFVIGLIPVVGTGGLSPWVGTVPGMGVAGPQMPGWVAVPGTSKVDRFLAAKDSGGLVQSHLPSQSGLGPVGGNCPSGRMPGAASRSSSPVPSPSQKLGGKDVPGPEDASLARFRQAQQSTAGQAVVSVAEARALKEAELQKANQQAIQYYQRGQQAEQAGKIPLALFYYRLAAREATGPLKAQILARQKALESSRPFQP